MGYPEYTGDAAFIPITRNPRTPQVADEYGNATIYGTTDNANANFPIDERVAEFIQYGVLNGSFARGPQDTAHDVTDINPLPDWTGPASVSGGAITAQWVADASSPSGYNLRFTVNAGAAGDEAYFEQIVPIGGARSQIAGDAVRFSVYRQTATSNGFQAYCTIRYLDNSLATLGSDTTTSLSWTADAQLQYNAAIANSAVINSTARYIRIRIGVKRNTAAASDSGTFDFSDVRRDPARGYLLLADTSAANSKVAARINADGGGLDLIPGGGGVGLTVFNNAISSPGSMVVVEAAAYTATGGSGTCEIWAKTDHTLRATNGSGTEFLLSALDTTTGALTLPSTGSGVGVAFPATQVPSSDANTLDDYEEGTFTPALAYATPGTSSWAVTTQTGFYTKIGNRVMFNGVYQGVPTNGTASGNLQFTGLPVTSNTTASSGASVTVAMQGWTKASYTQITGVVATNTTTMLFRANGSGQANSNLVVGDIPTGGTVIVQFSGFYLV